MSNEKDRDTFEEMMADNISSMRDLSNTMELGLSLGLTTIQLFSPNPFSKIAASYSQPLYSSGFKWVEQQLSDLDSQRMLNYINVFQAKELSARDKIQYGLNTLKVLGRGHQEDLTTIKEDLKSTREKVNRRFRETFKGMGDIKQEIKHVSSEFRTQMTELQQQNVAGFNDVIDAIKSTDMDRMEQAINNYHGSSSYRQMELKQKEWQYNLANEFSNKIIGRSDENYLRLESSMQASFSETNRNIEKLGHKMDQWGSHLAEQIGRAKTEIVGKIDDARNDIISALQISTQHILKNVVGLVGNLSGQINELGRMTIEANKNLLKNQVAMFEQFQKNSKIISDQINTLQISVYELNQSVYFMSEHLWKFEFRVSKQISDLFWRDFEVSRESVLDAWEQVNQPNTRLSEEKLTELRYDFGQMSLWATKFAKNAISSGGDQSVYDNDHNARKRMLEILSSNTGFEDSINDVVGYAHRFLGLPNQPTLVNPLLWSAVVGVIVYFPILLPDFYTKLNLKKISAVKEEGLNFVKFIKTLKASPEVLNKLLVNYENHVQQMISDIEAIISDYRLNKIINPRLDELNRQIKYNQGREAELLQQIQRFTNTRVFLPAYLSFNSSKNSYTRITSQLNYWLYWNHYYKCVYVQDTKKQNWFYTVINLGIKRNLRTGNYVNTDIDPNEIDYNNKYLNDVYDAKVHSISLSQNHIDILDLKYNLRNRECSPCPVKQKAWCVHNVAPFSWEYSCFWDARMNITSISNENTILHQFLAVESEMQLEKNCQDILSRSQRDANRRRHNITFVSKELLLFKDMQIGKFGNNKHSFQHITKICIDLYTNNYRFILKYIKQVVKNIESKKNTSHPYWTQIALFKTSDQKIENGQSFSNFFQYAKFEAYDTNMLGNGNFTKADNKRLYTAILIAEYLGFLTLTHTIQSQSKMHHQDVESRNNARLINASFESVTDVANLRFEIRSALTFRFNESDPFYSGYFMRGFINRFYLEEKRFKDLLWADCMYKKGENETVCFGPSGSEFIRPWMEYLSGSENNELVQTDEMFFGTMNYTSLKMKLDIVLSAHRKSISQLIVDKLTHKLNAFEVDYQLLIKFMQLAYSAELNANTTAMYALSSLYSERNIFNHIHRDVTTATSGEEFIHLYLNNTVLKHIETLKDFVSHQTKLAQELEKNNMLKANYPLVDNAISWLSAIQIVHQREEHARLHHRSMPQNLYSTLQSPGGRIGSSIATGIGVMMFDHKVLGSSGVRALLSGIFAGFASYMGLSNLPVASAMMMNDYSHSHPTFTPLTVPIEYLHHVSSEPAKIAGGAVSISTISSSYDTGEKSHRTNTIHSTPRLEASIDGQLIFGRLVIHYASQVYGWFWNNAPKPASDTGTLDSKVIEEALRKGERQLERVGALLTTSQPDLLFAWEEHCFNLSDLKRRYEKGIQVTTSDLSELKEDIEYFKKTVIDEMTHNAQIHGQTDRLSIAGHSPRLKQFGIFNHTSPHVLGAEPAFQLAAVASSPQQIPRISP